jgi:hypothetical protein
MLSTVYCLNRDVQNVSKVGFTVVLSCLVITITLYCHLYLKVSGDSWFRTQDILNTSEEIIVHVEGGSWKEAVVLICLRALL